MKQSLWSWDYIALQDAWDYVALQDTGDNIALQDIGDYLAPQNAADYLALQDAGDYVALQDSKEIKSKKRKGLHKAFREKQKLRNSQRQHTPQIAAGAT